MLERPKVGVAVLIFQNGKLLLGKRKNSHGNGCWAPPGGHLEFGETIEDCARREAFEETGLELDNLKIVYFTNDIFQEENKHYITIYARGEIKSGLLEVKEPDKCESWKWFDFDNLPTPLFLSLQNLLSLNNHYKIFESLI